MTGKVVVTSAIVVVVSLLVPVSRANLTLPYEGHGGDQGARDYESRGAYYHTLTATSVKVTSADRTTCYTPRARVRIWVYE